MHYHCEVVIPPGTENIEESIKSVMAQFSESMTEDEKEEFGEKYSFWDWWVIGGRWAGSKLMAGYDQTKLDEFSEWIQSEGITVAGFRSGKPELQPASQIAKVDAKWNEMFPAKGNVMVACPMFKHSNDQYSGKPFAGDICQLSQAKHVKCSRVIVAGPSFELESKEYTGPARAVFMLCDSIWNGVNHVDTKWDGTVGGAVDSFIEGSKNHAEQYKEKFHPTDEWITVTVDYHS